MNLSAPDTIASLKSRNKCEMKLSMNVNAMILGEGIRLCCRFEKSQEKLKVENKKANVESVNKIKLNNNNNIKPLSANFASKNIKTSIGKLNKRQLGLRSIATFKVGLSRSQIIIDDLNEMFKVEVYTLAIDRLKVKIDFLPFHFYTQTET